MYDELALKRFFLYLRAAWSKETSADPKNWAPINPAWGQCAVSVLMLQRAFGGEIFRLPIPRDSRKKITALGSHYFNKINGQIIDVSAEQFEEREYKHIIAKVRLAMPQKREELLENPDTRKRLELLFARMTRIASRNVIEN